MSDNEAHNSATSFQQAVDADTSSLVLPLDEGRDDDEVLLPPAKGWLARRAMARQRDWNTPRKVEEVKPKFELQIVPPERAKTENNYPSLSESLATAVDAYIEHSKEHITLNPRQPEISTFVRDEINPLSAVHFKQTVFFQKYVDTQTDVRNAFLNFQETGRSVVQEEEKTYALEKFDDFCNMLKDLHLIAVEGQSGEAVYRTDVTPGVFHTKKGLSNNYSSEFFETSKIARRYNDPFAEINPREWGTHRVYLPGIKTVDALPTNQSSSHNYPDSQYHEEYLQEMHRSFLNIQTLPEHSKPSEVITAVAEFYQYAANSHVFEQVNNSLFMNLTNSFLEAKGIQGIPHDSLDFAAMTLQPENFLRYFTAKVLEGQKERTQISPNPPEIVTDSVILPNDEILEINKKISEKTKRAFNKNEVTAVPYEARGSKKSYSKVWDCDVISVPTNGSEHFGHTYIIFDKQKRPITAQDIARFEQMTEFSVPQTPYVGIDQNGNTFFHFYGKYDSYEETTFSSVESALVSVEKLLDSQATLNQGIGLLTPDNKINVDALWTESVCISVYPPGNYIYAPVAIPQTTAGPEDEKTRSYQYMRKEQTAFLAEVFKKAGVNLQEIDTRKMVRISRGSRGMVFKDGETVVKTTGLLRKDDIYQMRVMSRFQGQTLPGFPKFLGFNVYKEQITQRYEFIPGLVPLNKFEGKLTTEEIDEALQNLDNFYEKTGNVHGDLHEENVQIQTTVENGITKNKVWFLDPCGNFNRANEIKDGFSVADDRSKASKLLHAT